MRICEYSLSHSSTWRLSGGLRYSDAGELLVKPTDRMVLFDLGDGQQPVRIPELIHNTIHLLGKWLYNNGVDPNDEVVAVKLSEGVKEYKDWLKAKGYGTPSDLEGLSDADSETGFDWEHVQPEYSEVD